MKLASTQFSIDHNSFELYISGCKDHPCKGCFSPELWKEDIGEELTPEKYVELIKNIVSKIDLIDNIFILGGEVMEKPKEDILTLLHVLKQFKKPIWLFTRFELDMIDKDILKEVDYVKTGLYDAKKKGKNVQFGITLASTNQKIHKVN
jgi:organic radical activating enzyme